MMMHIVTVDSDEDSILVRSDQIALAKRAGKTVVFRLLDGTDVTNNFASAEHAEAFCAAILDAWKRH